MIGYHFHTETMVARARPEAGRSMPYSAPFALTLYIASNTIQCVRTTVNNCAPCSAEGLPYTFHGSSDPMLPPRGWSTPTRTRASSSHSVPVSQWIWLGRVCHPRDWRRWRIGYVVHVWLSMSFA